MTNIRYVVRGKRIFFLLKFCYSLFLSLLLCLKVLELLNKNKSLDFEALKTFAQEDYWSRDKVAVRNPFFSSSSEMFQIINQREIEDKLGLNKKQFQVFSFFSHQNAVNKSFPCNTVGGSKTGVQTTNAN